MRSSKYNYVMQNKMEQTNPSAHMRHFQFALQI